MKKNRKENTKVMKRTLLAVISFILMAAIMNTAWAESPLSATEISSRSAEVQTPAEEVPVKDDSSKEEENPLRIGVTPLYGLLRSADGNQLLLNKYSAGFAAEVRLSPNISVEGVFRYAEYNVRPDLVIRSYAISRVSSAFQHGPGGNDRLGRLGFGVVGDMTQMMLGGNIKYELFPRSVIVPYVGGGVVHFSNEYYTDSHQNFVKVTLPQSIYGLNAIGGLKLKLSRYWSILCRAEAGSLLNNRNGKLFFRNGGENAQVYHAQNFRSYDRYVAGLVGISFGM